MFVCNAHSIFIVFMQTKSLTLTLTPLTDKSEEAKKEREAKMKEELKKLDAKYKHQHIVAMVSKQGTEEVTRRYYLYSLYKYKLTAIRARSGQR